MKVAVTFQIGDWTHTVSAEREDDPEMFVRSLLRPHTLMTDALNEFHGCPGPLATRLNEIRVQGRPERLRPEAKLADGFTMIGDPQPIGNRG